VTTGAISRAKLQSNRHHQQTYSQLFTGWMQKSNLLACQLVRYRNDDR